MAVRAAEGAVGGVDVQLGGAGYEGNLLKRRLHGKVVNHAQIELRVGMFVGTLGAAGTFVVMQMRHQHLVALLLMHKVGMALLDDGAGRFAGSGYGFDVDIEL